MKKLLQYLGVTAAAIVLMLLPFAVHAEDVGKPTVVYLADGGAGDGSSASSPVGSLTDAYNALDLTKDCTVVVCGEFEQTADFAYAADYTGSVTLTSVYGGIDYRVSGAVYNVNNKRFVCAGETRFENMTFNALGTYILVVGQHHPVTVGEGAEMTGGFDGTGLTKSFAILGGYQSTPSSSDADTGITVLSGSKLCLVGYCRNVANGVYSGNADIKIGGDAEVSQLYLSAVSSSGSKVGNIKVEIFGNASVGNIYGTSNATTAASVKLLWCSGSIGAFTWKNTGGSATLEVTGDKMLEATANVQSAANYATVKANFTTVSTHAHSYDSGVVTRRATCTQEGERLYSCAGCSHTYTETISATGVHTPGGWTVDVPATEEHEGRKVQKCTECDEVLDSCVIPRLEKTLTDADRAVIAVLISALRRNTYTVRFDTTGAAQIKSQSVKDGARATIPETPVREGYTFGGWYTDRTYWFEFDFTDSIRKNTTIIAKWIPNEIK